jgi:hypothetical protein
LDGEAKPVSVATTLPDQRHVGVGKAVVLYQVILTF